MNASGSKNRPSAAKGKKEKRQKKMKFSAIGLLLFGLCSLLMLNTAAVDAQFNQQQCDSYRFCFCRSASVPRGYCVLTESHCQQYANTVADAHCAPPLYTSTASRGNLIFEAEPAVLTGVVLKFQDLRTVAGCVASQLCWCNSSQFALGYCVPNESLCRSAAQGVSDIRCGFDSPEPVVPSQDGSRDLVFNSTSSTDPSSSAPSVPLSAATLACGSPSSICSCRFVNAWKPRVPVRRCFNRFYCESVLRGKCQ
jgi:hypothetical protein